VADGLQELSKQFEVRPNDSVNEKGKDKDEANNEKYSQGLMRTASRSIN